MRLCAACVLAAAAGNLYAQREITSSHPDDRTVNPLRLREFVAGGWWLTDRALYGPSREVVSGRAELLVDGREYCAVHGTLEILSKANLR